MQTAIQDPLVLFQLLSGLSQWEMHPEVREQGLVRLAIQSYVLPRTPDPAPAMKSLHP